MKKENVNFKTKLMEERRPGRMRQGGRDRHLGRWAFGCREVVT